MLDQELARLKRVSSTRFGEFAQVPLMIVLSQCCFSICLYQSRGFGLLAWEIKTWCWVGQETGVYLLVDISCWRGNFLQGGENEHIFGWLPPSPSPPPPLCGKVYLFSSPSLLDIHLCSQICNTSPPLFGTHHGKIPDSMIHQNQGDSLLVKPACHLISIQDTFSIYLILNVSWIDTIVTISIAIGTGCNFLHGEDGTKSYYMKTHAHQLQTNDTQLLKQGSGHRSTTASLWSFTAHSSHVVIIMTGGFSKKCFLLIFSRISFKQSSTCYIGT